MYDCKIRWGYLSRSALRRFGLEEEQERQKKICFSSANKSRKLFRLVC